MLPPTVAQGLLRGDDVRTHYDAATIAFISLDDFKDMGFKPAEVLAELGPVYMHLDGLLAQHYGDHLAKVSCGEQNAYLLPSDPRSAPSPGRSRPSQIRTWWSPPEMAALITPLLQ